MASEEDQLRRDIDTARDSFNRDWKELAQTHLTPEERHGLSAIGHGRRLVYDDSP
jgi:hypothetical protein